MGLLYYVHNNIHQKIILDIKCHSINGTPKWQAGTLNFKTWDSQTKMSKEIPVIYSLPSEED